MSGPAPHASADRCGIDSVEIARIERLLRETSPEDLRRIYSQDELADAGDGAERAASLAARFAAKEACLKLFPRETAMARIDTGDFAVTRGSYGEPRVVATARAQAVLDRYRVREIRLSLTHDRGNASAVALAVPAAIDVPFLGRLLYRIAPYRRKVILDNLRRVYGDVLPETEIVRIAQAHYAHLGRLLGEFVRFRWLSARQKAARVRVDNLEAFLDAQARGKGVLIVTGHFGNWEVATIAGLHLFPHARGRFHFVRRAIKPHWLDRMVTRRFNRAGFGVIGKRGTLDTILDRLAAGDAVVFPFDQHARPPDGIDVEFFGHPAWTFKSLAILALATGAPVLPASSWRELDGRHVLRFEAPVDPVEHGDANADIRATTRAYNEALERMILRRPEQWYWVHRRWKTAQRRRSPRAANRQSAAS
jgi:KDO2-lipid IV(A) lauroyltransferase